MDESPARPLRTSSGTRTATIEVKRRACDECRSRKLACSKESDGCARCKREGIDCHYSAQKPMGRPRKRQSTGSYSTRDAAAPAAVQDVREEGQDVPHAGLDAVVMHDTTMDLDPSSLTDPSLSCNADMPMPDMSFLDFLDSDFMLNQPFGTDTVPSAMSTEPSNWATNLFDNNFNAHSEEPGGSTNLITPSLSSQGTSPSDQPPSQHTPSAFPPSPSLLQPPSCSCLANLYLALDSIARLPTEVVAALRIARTAAHTAYDAIHCNICCPPIHKTTKLAASAFQNTQLLGALIPSLADAYHQILGLVDAEATRAISTHTQLTFALSAYGGTWGTLLPPCDVSAAGSGPGGVDVYEDKVMDPAAWRRSVRSLLKIDVYGVDTRDCSGQPRFRQIGLRDLVAEMDEKSRVRHTEVDALIDAGLPAPIGMGGLPARHTRGREPHCRHVIQLAREAVENLHIA